MAKNMGRIGCVKKILKMDVHPTDQDVVYASGNRVFLRSTNGGSSWQDLTYSVSWTQNNTTRFLPLNCRIAVSTCSLQPDDLYLLSYNPDSGDEILLHSTNQGDTWSFISSRDFSGRSYILHLSVAPNGNIYAGGVFLYRSLSATPSDFDQQYNIHADIRDIVFPNGVDDTQVYIAHDGGVSVPNTQRPNRWLNQCNGLAVNQFYALDAAELDPDFWLGGTHDCGSYHHTSASGWQFADGGDGGSAIIDQVNNSTCYAVTTSFKNGKLLPILTKSVNKAVSFSNTDTVLLDYDAPMQIRPDNNNHLFIGKWRVLRSIDKGVNFTCVSPVSAGIQPISAMKMAESNPDYLYYALKPWYGTKAKLYRTTQNTQTLTGTFDITDIKSTNSQLQSALNEAMVTDIEVHPDNPETLWISIGNFSHGNKVFYSTTGGNSWTNISNGLPEIPVQSLAYNKFTGTLFAGTDAGLYYLLQGESTWQLSGGLPLVIISDIRINYASNRIIVATYGRGIWSAPLQCPSIVSEKINISRTSYPANKLCKGTVNTLKATYSGDCEYNSFDWIIPSSCTRITTFGTKKEYAEIVTPNNYNLETIKAALNTDYGISNYKSQTFSKTYCGYRYIYKYSPNPADSYLDVSRAAIRADEKEDPVEIQKQLDREKYYEIILYNKEQKPEFRQKTSNRQVRINTSRLEPGIYFLHIIVNDEIIMKEQIVIK